MFQVRTWNIFVCTLFGLMKRLSVSHYCASHIEIKF
jgi:hypothetical protein